MDTYNPTPVDRAMDPDKHFESEAQHWWRDETLAYGVNRLDGFEVHSTHIFEWVGHSRHAWLHILTPNNLEDHFDA